MDTESFLNILVSWRGKQFNVNVMQDSKIKDLGEKLLGLTNVRPDTMKLFVQQKESKSSRMIAPFSEEHAILKLRDLSIVEGKTIKMMGVSNNEIEEISRNRGRDLRILGFEEEEKRLRQRSFMKPQNSLKLPTGNYIFCDFRTLQIPGIELNPPAPEALRRMHMLACDPGIIAIMNKHRWRVGVMTEMAPIGYVGISPKCILGFNKNCGEEISLRLRTDDLKGFRKYESIKKTLLHELAHMVYSEHDANFFALNKQLNEEAASLDWTRLKSYTLSGSRMPDYLEEDEISLVESGHHGGQKLGGSSDAWADPRTNSVEAAYRRFITHDHTSDNLGEPGPDDSMSSEPDPDDTVATKYKDMVVDIIVDPSVENYGIEPDPDDLLEKDLLEPDPDDSTKEKAGLKKCEPDPYDALESEAVSGGKVHWNQTRMILKLLKFLKDSRQGLGGTELKASSEPDPDDSPTNVVTCKRELMEPTCGSDETIKNEPNPYGHISILNNNEELQRIEEPVAAICSRLERAIDTLRKEVRPADSMLVLQTLLKIVRNVIEHPNEMKFRRLRKANPQFQRNVAIYTAAMEVLNMIGFSEDIVSDEVGRTETYMVLKRNDPGLLWLAKSYLEVTSSSSHNT